MKLCITVQVVSFIGVFFQDDVVVSNSDILCSLFDSVLVLKVPRSFDGVLVLNVRCE